jgi:hypothetical protein
MKKPLKRLSTKCYENAMELLDEASINRAEWDDVAKAVSACGIDLYNRGRLRLPRGGRELLLAKKIKPYKMVSSGCRDTLLNTLFRSRKMMRDEPDEANRLAAPWDELEFTSTIDCRTELQNYNWKEYKEVWPY